MIGFIKNALIKRIDLAIEKELNGARSHIDEIICHKAEEMVRDSLSKVDGYERYFGIHNHYSTRRTVSIDDLVDFALKAKANEILSEDALEQKVNEIINDNTVKSLDYYISGLTQERVKPELTNPENIKIIVDEINKYQVKGN